MSVFVQTSREEPKTRTSILRDYEVHSTSTPVTETRPAEVSQHLVAREKQERQRLDMVENPDDWLEGYRRIPKFRPINKCIDKSTRTAGDGTLPLYIFINGLIGGVAGVAKISQAWRATFGRVLPEVFHYEIGGEW